MKDFMVPLWLYFYFLFFLPWVQFPYFRKNHSAFIQLQDCVPLLNPEGFWDCQRHRSSPVWLEKKAWLIMSCLYFTFLSIMHVAEFKWFQFTLTHPLQVVFSRPAQLFLRQSWICIAGGHITVASRCNLIGNLEPEEKY